jgi:predicted  nucleic acid-binding Zn-ribbon protein
MRQELHDMKERVSAQERDVKSMETLANASMHDYDMLKTAKMLEVSNGDLEATRQRINKLVRDVDRCITLLSEQQNNSQK